jgi:xylulokinase
MATDHSYASGSGIYDLKKERYCWDTAKSMQLPPDIFPEIVPSTHVLGQITEEAANATGLPKHVKVACGGVDNSCMALGARGIKNGRVYTSLGSSAWIAVTSDEPVLDTDAFTYVFAHILPHMFTSATAIFSAGSSFQWIRNQICANLMNDPQIDVYKKMNELAEKSPVGANRLLFNPSLAGGCESDDTQNIRGAFIGLDLRHTQADIIRAAMEGVALALRRSLLFLERSTDIPREMLLVGGGGNSLLWRQIFANVYGMDILKTSVGQDAGSLGAAAVASVAAGFWKDYSPIDDAHEIELVHKPDPAIQAKYDALFGFYEKANKALYELSDQFINVSI